MRRAAIVQFFVETTGYMHPLSTTLRAFGLLVRYIRVLFFARVQILVPRRPEPPAHFPARLQPELQQPQQAHRHPLRLTGPLDRVGRPRQGLRTTFPWVFWGFHGKYKIFT